MHLGHVEAGASVAHHRIAHIFQSWQVDQVKFSQYVSTVYTVLRKWCWQWRKQSTFIIRYGFFIHLFISFLLVQYFKLFLSILLLNLPLYNILKFSVNTFSIYPESIFKKFSLNFVNLHYVVSLCVKNVSIDHGSIIFSDKYRRMG